MILREMLAILEGKNHMGDAEQMTWSGWRAACKKVNKDVWFEGDKDIAQAMVGPKPYKHGETKSIGEWDGEKGSVFAHAKAVKEAKGGPKERAEKFEPGWYVVDEDDVPIHGPFDNERKANRECANLGGQKRGYTIDFIEKLKEEMEAFEAWKESVKDAYPNIAGKLKFKSNPEGNVEALIPGEDRIYGIFDVDKDSGEILKD